MGCGKDLPTNFAPGQTTILKRKVPGTQRRAHAISLPGNYTNTGTTAEVSSSPPPLMFYFHGWSGNRKECGRDCTKSATDRGFLSVSMTGYGKNYRYAYNSWNFAGSSTFPQPREPVCNTAGINKKNSYCRYYRRAGQCDSCSDDDGCWWTTCFDSVQQVLSLYEELKDKLCFDLDRVWAVGCSNGGMFTYELAKDERSANVFRGIVPIVGLPHYGEFTNIGPLVEGTSLFGLYGVKDKVVPPKAKTESENQNKTQDTSGYLYTSYSKVVETWTHKNGCAGDGQDTLEAGDPYGATESGLFDCVQGCKEKNGTHVVGCIFDGGHICSSKAGVPWNPIFNFMLSHH